MTPIPSPIRHDSMRPNVRADPACVAYGRCTLVKDLCNTHASLCRPGGCRLYPWTAVYIGGEPVVSIRVVYSAMTLVALRWLTATWDDGWAEV